MRNQVVRHACFILAKNLAAFCLCPEHGSETKFTGNGLSCWEEAVPGQQNIQAVAWLLLAAFS